MTRFRNLVSGLTALFFLAYSGLALAVYGQQVILEGSEANAMQGQTVSFTSASGETLQSVVEVENGQRVVNLEFSGDRSNGLSESGVLRVGNGAFQITLPPAAADQSIYVNVNDATATAGPPTGRPVPGSGNGAPPGWELGIGVSASELETPAIGTSGVTSTPDGEAFVQSGIDSVYLTGASVALARSLDGARNMTLYGSFSSASGDDQASAGVPTATTATGLVFTDFFMDTTGIGVFPAGMDSTADVDVDQDLTSFGFRFNLLGNASEQRRWSPGIAITSGSLEILQHSVDRFTDPFFGATPPVVTRQQRLDQSYYELYPSIRLTSQTAPRVAWYWEAGPVFRDIDADWQSNERIQCAVCGAPLEDVTIVASDSLSDTSVGASVNVGLQFAFGSNAVLEANAFYRGGMDNAAPTNPQSGDDLFIRNRPTHLETDSASDFGVALRLLFAF